MSYKIVRMYQNPDKPNRTIKTGLTLAEAQAHCRAPETSSKTATSPAGRKRTRDFGPWFDGYSQEPVKPAATTGRSRRYYRTRAERAKHWGF